MIACAALVLVFGVFVDGIVLQNDHLAMNHFATLANNPEVRKRAAHAAARGAGGHPAANMVINHLATLVSNQNASKSKHTRS